MPIYTYRCGECGVQFDKQQSYSDAPLVKCPECGKKSLIKVITPAGIIFKGSGWYATDHRSPSGQTLHREKKEKESEATATATVPPASGTASTASEASSPKKSE